MTPTITAGGIDMKECRQGRKRKRISLRYLGRIGQQLPVNACTETDLYGVRSGF